MSQKLDILERYWTIKGSRFSRSLVQVVLVVTGRRPSEAVKCCYTIFPSSLVMLSRRCESNVEWQRLKVLRVKLSHNVCYSILKYTQMKALSFLIWTTEDVIIKKKSSRVESRKLTAPSLNDDLSCAVCNAKVIYLRTILFFSLQEWSLEEWNDECARFTFLKSSLEMVVSFGLDIAG